MKRQRGQGLVEALFAVAVLGLCAQAISWVGRLQYQAMAAAQDSRVAAFSVARGQEAASAARADFRLRISREAAAAGASGRGETGSLSREWLRVDERLLRASAERDVEATVGFEQRRAGERSVVLARHTTVAQAGGHAASDADGQNRLVASATGWGRAGDTSLALSRRLRDRIAGIEAAWGERAPGNDWVSVWADLVPSQRLGKRGGQ
jgi:hypothetical protein